MFDPLLSLFLVTAIGIVAMAGWYLREWRLLWRDVESESEAIRAAEDGASLGIAGPASDDVPWEA